MIHPVLLVATIVGAGAGVGDITVRHVTTLTIPNGQDNSNLKELELLHRHVLNQHFSALALGPHPDLIEPRLASIIEKEAYVDTPVDEARQACALDARRLCTDPEDKAALHCLGMADLKLKQPVTEQCRTKVRLSIPYACSVEINEHRCTGEGQSLFQCIEEKADKVSGDCADSLYLTKKFLKVWDTTKKSLEDRKGAQTKKDSNGMGLPDDNSALTFEDPVLKVQDPKADATVATPQQGFAVAGHSHEVVNGNVALGMLGEAEKVTEFSYGLILVILAAGISIWACLFASPRRLADDPAIVSVEAVQLEVTPLLKNLDTAKSEVLL